MEINEIKSKLIDMLTGMLPDARIDVDVLEYVDLINDYCMNSITFISFVVNIEDTFDIKVPDDLLYIDNFRSIDGIIKIIYDAKSGQKC